jgi:hypothetical protein
MPSLPVRLLLFISSYFPLAVILCIFLLDPQHPWLIAGHVAAVVILGVGLLGLVIMVLYVKAIAPARVAFHEKITDLERHDGDVMSYIASYVVPFVTFTLGGWQQISALVIFLLLLLVIYVSSNMIYVNPMLTLFGYHLYEIKIENSASSHYLITNQHIMRNKSVRVVKIGDEAFLETRM